MVNKKDLIFISGDFFDFEIPKEKNYLFKYFRKDIQQKFIKYFFAFGDFENFVDHTGLYCQRRWLKILYKKLLKLESAHKIAKSNIDLNTLIRIEAGKYKFQEFKNV